jgi:hypothetical protein
VSVKFLRRLPRPPAKTRATARRGKSRLCAISMGCMAVPFRAGRNKVTEWKNLLLSSQGLDAVKIQCQLTSINVYKHLIFNKLPN